MPTRITSTFHASSSVVSSFKARLVAPHSYSGNSNGAGIGGPEHLVIAKIDSIEVHSILKDGLKKECSIAVRGRVGGVWGVKVPVSVLHTNYIHLGRRISDSRL